MTLFLFFGGLYGLYGLSKWVEYKTKKHDELTREMKLRDYYNSGKPKNEDSEHIPY
jgi:hypothetical protein